MAIAGIQPRADRLPITRTVDRTVTALVSHDALNASFKVTVQRAMRGRPGQSVLRIRLAAEIAL